MSSERSPGAPKGQSEKQKNAHRPASSRGGSRSKKDQHQQQDLPRVGRGLEGEKMLVRSPGPFVRRSCGLCQKRGAEVKEEDEAARKVG